MLGHLELRSASRPPRTYVGKKARKQTFRMHHPSLIFSLPTYEASVLTCLFACFLTDSPILKVAQWTFRNNGDAFKDEDWTRLRKIGVYPLFELRLLIL